MIKIRLVVYFIFILGVLNSCTPAVKSSWRNFNAYYNTFFNAKQYYSNGYASVLKQQPPINPERPIRIFESPTKTGVADFDNAILKGAKILREYDDTKWTDNAILLIGKSYFFLEQYFSSEQKFNELLLTSESLSLKRDAIFWKGRMFLEMSRLQEGIQYLRDELANTELSWTPRDKARVEAVLAELYVQQRAFDMAYITLQSSLLELEEKRILARAWFLYGQLSERESQFEEAMNAFRKVPTFNPEYSLVFEANRKEAQIARQLGELDVALKLFTKMSKDDKNFDLSADLKYEIGRTLQDKREFEKAEDTYIQILRNPLLNPSKESQALIYYGLGNIALNYYRDLTLAAAYFDTSATRASSSEKLPESFDAEELASAYGEYSSWKKKAVRYDSLLWLGTLPQEQLDSVIAVVEARLEEEQEKRREALESQKNTMINVNAGNVNNPNANQNENARDNGFLGIKNPSVIDQASASFKAIWGNRPLVDNWRRLSAIRSSYAGARTEEEEQVSSKGKSKSQSSVKLNLDEIPRSTEAQQKMKEDLATALFEMGNVFFLSLNQPDSAKQYYQIVIDRFDSTQIYPKVNYSLSELYYVMNDTSLSRSVAQRLVKSYPQNPYSRRLAEKFEMPLADSSVVDTSIVSYSEAYIELRKQFSSEKNSMAYIDSLKQLAERYSKEKAAGEFLFEAASLYAEKAKSSEVFKESFKRWNEKNKQFEDSLARFEALKDSAQEELQDPEITTERAKEISALLDSSIVRPDFSAFYPYLGELWDSTRVTLKKLSTTFSSSPKKKVADQLLKELSIPQSLLPKEPEITEQEPDSLSSFELPSDSLTLQQKNESVNDSLLIVPVVQDSSRSAPVDTTARQRGGKIPY